MMNTQQKYDLVDERENGDSKKKTDVKLSAKKVLIGAGARFLFYPTLFYNVIRYNIDSDFRWWDPIDQFLLLGAVPFPKDVPKLKELGVGGVITLNEPFETLVPTSMYKDHGMEHLIIPTRDYLYAPSFEDINIAVDFIHNNASRGIATYVHCKAGRGRSTTIALCYLVKHKQMTPSTAMDLIRAQRPRVLLTSMQANAVEQYYRSCSPVSTDSASSDEVLVTQADLEGYEENSEVAPINQKKSIPKAARILPISTTLSSLLSSLTNACCCASRYSQKPKQSTC
ncbi:hypothetical protein BVRB_8g197840 [Beta vulgaris subsp. vulgaris]|nr:hypothetical protein BVRB_8g197840 [Beta vulgaris subsp. vulgaris]